MEIGVKTPDILLPKAGADYTKWAVVACDQFTSEPQYWRELEQTVGDAPSTLAITFPEVYLNQNDEQRIDKINRTMREYLERGVFAPPVHGFVLTDRSTQFFPHRIGLVLAVDLEQYSYAAADHALIRATEGTILSRIPPRVKIREHAPLELPHVMLLIDDRARSVIEPLYRNREQLKKLYDFDLNQGGGHIAGWLVENTAPVENALAELLNADVLREKYGDTTPFLFAVGDGNHSLATAKTCWENLKPSLTEQQRRNHPARYALVEVVNIFDEGLQFEPIHRVVFGAKPEFAENLVKSLSGSGSGTVVAGNGDMTLNLPQNAADAVGAVQRCIDEAIQRGECRNVDYVHGEESVRNVVAANPEAVGVLLPAMDKNDLFYSVLKNGSLPRKTFSMGEATEKRYYLESRLISEER